LARILILKSRFSKSDVKIVYYLTHYRPAMPFGNRKKYFKDLFSSVLSQLKKYNPSGNLKFNYLGIFQSLKLRIFEEMQEVVRHGSCPTTQPNDNRLCRRTSVSDNFRVGQIPRRTNSAFREKIL